MPGGSSPRRKGNRAELEVCQILTELGVPTQRVVSSGAIIGAKGDLRVGVELDKDGNFPQRDEGTPMFRAECKNRATNPEKPFIEISNTEVVGVVDLGGKCTEVPFKDLAQSSLAKIGVWRRKRVPNGALAKGDYNQVYVCFMGIVDFAALLKELKGYRKKYGPL